GYRDAAVETSSGQWLRAELFVGADGASSPLRAAAGIAHKSVPYEDTGLVAHLDAERPHHGTAFQWFRDDGVLALLPLPDTSAGPQVSMVWSMHNAHAKALQALAPDEQAARLEQMLAHAAHGRLARLRMPGRRQGFP